MLICSAFIILPPIPTFVQLKQRCYNLIIQKLGSLNVHVRFQPMSHCELYVAADTYVRRDIKNNILCHWWPRRVRQNIVQSCEASVIAGACRIYSPNEQTVIWIAALRSSEWTSPLPVNDFVARLGQLLTCTECSDVETRGFGNVEKL
jgi:hypothetical protein